MRPIRYISLCSGVEAASLAWMPFGWEPVAYAEVDEFPSAILAARFPDTPNLGDISRIDWSEYRGAADLVCGGTPCQAFSIAGKRRGLLDERGRLMLEFVRAVSEIGPRYVVWENVFGTLSQDRGRAFGTLIRELAELGYCCGWTVLDAQFARVPVRDSDGRITGWIGPVPQRRRRVFLVGVLGGPAGRVAEILGFSSRVRGDTPSSSQKREELAADARAGSADADRAGAIIGEPLVMAHGHSHAEIAEGGVAPTVLARAYKDPPMIFARTRQDT